MKLYPFDEKTMNFRKGKVLRSRRKYADKGEGALVELGLPYRDMLKNVPKTEEYR